MNYSKDFSIIIPVWRGALKFLPRLLNSIPNNDRIEIIVVDNSKEHVSREELRADREICFLHSAYERHAGGSRNDGIKAAKGKWLLFADADDYYTPDAFDVYYSKLNTDAEIVYTGMGGVYEDTGEPSDRGDLYAQLVHDYCIGQTDENMLRLKFASPCCKMVSHDLVNRHNLRYDEIRAGNDKFFSISSGFYAHKIEAIDIVTYIATVNYGSLTKRRDYEVIQARLYSQLHCNKFLRENGLSKYQSSIMFALAEARHYGIRGIVNFLRMIVKFRQNPFVGCQNWVNTLRKKNRTDKRDAIYFVQ